MIIEELNKIKNNIEDVLQKAESKAVKEDLKEQLVLLNITIIKSRIEEEYGTELPFRNNYMLFDNYTLGIDRYSDYTLCSFTPETTIDETVLTIEENEVYNLDEYQKCSFCKKIEKFPNTKKIYVCNELYYFWPASCAKTIIPMLEKTYEECKNV